MIRNEGRKLSCCQHENLTSAYKLIVQWFLDSIIDVFEWVNSASSMGSALILRLNIC